MKTYKKKIIIGIILTVVISALAVLLLLWAAPKKIKLNTEDISYIEIQSGGDIAVVSDKEDLKPIFDEIGRLNPRFGVKNKKKGWFFSIDFYDSTGKSIDRITVVGKSRILRNGNGYRADADDLVKEIWQYLCLTDYYALQETEPFLTGHIIPSRYSGSTPDSAISSFESELDCIIYSEYKDNIEAEKASDFIPLKDLLCEALDRIKKGETYAYVPDNGAEITEYVVYPLLNGNADKNPPFKSIELAISCKYLYGGRAYSVIWVSNPDNFDINLVSYSGDDKYTAECGGYDVTFYGYYDYNTASGKYIDYISAFSVNIGGETVYFMPDSSRKYMTFIRSGQKSPSVDIEATNEFFASLDEDFFKLDKLNLADFVSKNRQ